MSRGAFPAWLKWMLISAGLVSVIAVSALMFLVFGQMSDRFLTSPLNPAEYAPISGKQTETSSLKPAIQVEYAEVPITPVSEDEAAQIPTSAPLPVLSNTERTTILVMGLDRRPNENYPTRTDTMILMSFDPNSQDASMLSVPRDLYIDIPGYGRERINAAYVLGALYEGGEAGGAELAMETIERNLGVMVDHYVLIDFNAVTNLIDAIGGVQVDVPETIDDPTYPDMNYGYDPLYIPAGLQTLNGETALKYMRTRHGDSDFERSRRQQLTLFALREQLEVLGATGLARRAPQIWTEVQGGVFTDMTLNDMLGLLNVASGLSAESINSGVIDYNYASGYTTTAGASVLVLKTQEVAGLISELFD